MMKLGFLCLLFSPFALGCYLYNVDYKGTNLNAEHSIRTADAQSCQKLCQKEPNCYYFTWATEDYFDHRYRKDCYLKSRDSLIKNEDGLISGPRECNQQSCCDSLKLDSTGMADFYQGERLGTYVKIGNSQDGRNVYRQQSGDNYLFFLSAKSVWMVGKEIGKDSGGILNRASPFCPEDTTRDWEYWVDWMEEWREDWVFEAKCPNDDDNGGEDPDEDGEACASGSACENCPIWSSVNGIKYCCAVDCHYGSVSVNEQNGHVVCTCKH